MSEPKKFGPSDFAAEVERLKAAGKLPSLETFVGCNRRNTSRVS